MRLDTGLLAKPVEEPDAINGSARPGYPYDDSHGMDLLRPLFYFRNAIRL
jgi:hypothetical protein